MKARNPNSEIRNKHEARSFNVPNANPRLEFGTSSLGFVSCFGIGNSCFRRLALVFAVASAVAGRAAGASPVDLGVFGSIPVLEGGRPMPLSAYARVAMLQMSGRTTWQGGPASHWLARALFEPDATTNDAIFLISHPDTFDALGLATDKPRRRASYAELEPVLPRLRDLSSRAAGVKAADRTPADRDLLQLVSAISLFAAFSRGDHPAIVPRNGGHDPWLALSEAAQPADADAAMIATAWSGLRKAWLARDTAAFTDAARTARAAALHGLDDPRAGLRLRGEETMNRLRPFTLSLQGYLVAAVLGFWVALDPRRRKTALAAAILVGLALLAHSAGLLLRAFIMGRPPVTNLYSTFVFVAWCCAAIGLGVERARRDGLGLLAGGTTAVVLLAVAGRYELDGDTMQRVVAVLDSNFWLTVHVLTIMVGYAGCLMAGAAAHVQLVKHGLQGAASAAPVARAVRGLLGLGLVFTFLGTMLGGVWADQSWGRFWGWDPKENGALLIVLWTAVVLHARGPRLIGDVGMAVGAVLGIVVVAIAWQGVNLLGVGLHSYGFTSGAAFWLTLIAAVEVIFCAATAGWIRSEEAGSEK